MSALELDKFKKRYHQLGRREEAHRGKHKFLKARSRRSGIALTSTQEILLKQTEARERSRELLYRTALQHSGNGHRQSQDLPGWWMWLERLERELSDQKMFLDRNHKKYIRDDAERDRRWMAWQAELDARQRQSMEAMELVLKFNASKFANSRSLQENCLKRISSPSFPPELRVLVGEATVRSQLPYWRTDESTSLEQVTEKVFQEWPKTLGNDERSSLQQISARAMLTHSLIILPSIFTLQCTLETPPEIRKSEHLIRHLALDLFTQTRDGTYNRELNRASQGMASLKLLFPNLESCVVMVHLRHNFHLVDYNLTNGRRADLPGSARECLSLRNVKKASNIITLEQTLVEFIAAFLEHGPGKRKFVRFAHSDIRTPELKLIGPLARVKSQEPLCSVLTTQELTPEEGQENADAKRIFKAAYWPKGGPLGNWKVSFREQQA